MGPDWLQLMRNILGKSLPVHLNLSRLVIRKLPFYRRAVQKFDFALKRLKHSIILRNHKQFMDQFLSKVVSNHNPFDTKLSLLDVRNYLFFRTPFQKLSLVVLLNKNL